MGDKTQIHIQVEKEKKKNWGEYAEEHPEIPSSNLSQLIRRAVYNEIEGSHSESSNDGTATVDLSEVTEQQARTESEMAKLRNVVEQMDSRVEEVQREVTSDRKKRPLEDRLMEALPPAKPKSQGWNRARDMGPDAPRSQWETAWSGELFDLCKRVGETPDTVEEKLDEMGVPRQEVDGELRYWMEGQV